MDVASEDCVVRDGCLHFFISLFNQGMVCLKAAQEGSCRLFPHFLSHLYILCPDISTPDPDKGS